jgi:hypothetical protein
MEPFRLSQAKFCVLYGCPWKFETPLEPNQFILDYEQERNLNIQRNNAFLESLGLKGLMEMKIVHSKRGSLNKNVM